MLCQALRRNGPILLQAHTTNAEMYGDMNQGISQEAG